MQCATTCCYTNMKTNEYTDTLWKRQANKHIDILAHNTQDWSSYCLFISYFIHIHIRTCTQTSTYIVHTIESNAKSFKQSKCIKHRRVKKTELVKRRIKQKKKNYYRAYTCTNDRQNNNANEYSVCVMCMWVCLCNREKRLTQCVNVFSIEM